MIYDNNGMVPLTCEKTQKTFRYKIADTTWTRRANRQEWANMKLYGLNSGSMLILVMSGTDSALKNPFKPNCLHR